MNKTLKNATVKKYYYRSHQHLKEHLYNFVMAYNYARRLKTLNGLTPFEFICLQWTKSPDLFTLNPHHHTLGPYILDYVAKLYGRDKSIEYKNCYEILIKHTLEKNPNIEMPDSVKNNKELAQCWNACEANNEGWELIIPSTETQVVSVQKVNKSRCSIQ